MNYKNISAILLLPFFIISCNYKLLVDKRKIVQNQKGYLVFRTGEVTFYPTKDTIDVIFLSNTHKQEGYQLEYDTDWLDSLSTDYSRLLYIKNDKRLSIIPVEISYYLGSLWQITSDKGTIDYKLDNKTYILQYENADYRQILGISLVRDSDRKRWKDMPVDTTKFVPPHWHPVE